MQTHAKIIISEQPPSLDAALTFIANTAHGADCIFIGKVRNHNEGQEVVAIEYDICQALAEKILHQIVEKILQNYHYHLKIFIYHGFGKLSVGQTGMLVAVSAPHRAEAYAANREIVEAIKHRCPIWKKEYYLHGSPQWLKGCALQHEI